MDAHWRWAEWNPLTVTVLTLEELSQPKSEDGTVPQGINAQEIKQDLTQNPSPLPSLQGSPQDAPQEFPPSTLELLSPSLLPCSHFRAQDPMPDSTSIVSHPSKPHWRGESQHNWITKQRFPRFPEQMTSEKLPKSSRWEQHYTIMKLIQHFYSEVSQEHLETFRKHFWCLPG